MVGADHGGLGDFVAARYAELRRSAFLMCADWALAEEFTQRSLTCLVAESRRTEVNDPDAYAYSHLMASFHRHSSRGKRNLAAASRPIPTTLVLDALQTLAPRCRAVLILRHWDGFAIDETADMLGLAAERVDAYEAAGLAALDYLLAAKVPVR